MENNKSFEECFKKLKQIQKIKHQNKINNLKPYPLSQINKVK